MTAIMRKAFDNRKTMRCIFTLAVFIFFYLIAIQNEQLNMMRITKEHSSLKTLLTKKIRTLYYEANGPLDRENEQRIFFHEASGNNYLSSRQTCAVESAAFHNPNKRVQLLMHTLEAPNVCSQWYQVLANYSNVELVMVDDRKYFNNTPLENWYFAGKWKQSRFKTEHFADYLRMLTVAKGGGLYLDLDYIVLKSLDSSKLSNFFVLEDDTATVFGNSVFHLQHDHPLGKLIIQHLVDDYDPESWGYHGSAVITAVMRDACRFREGKLHSNKCKNIRWLSSTSFFPIPFLDWEKLFKHTYGVGSIVNKLNETFAIHAWNKLSHHFPVTLETSQVYSYLALRNCPLTVAIAKDRTLS